MWKGSGRSFFRTLVLENFKFTLFVLTPIFTASIFWNDDIVATARACPALFSVRFSVSRGRGRQRRAQLSLRARETHVAECVAFPRGLCGCALIAARQPPPARKSSGSV